MTTIYCGSMILKLIVSGVCIPNKRSAVIYLVSLIITQLSFEYSLTLPLSCTLFGAATLPLHCHGSHKVTIYSIATQPVLSSQEAAPDCG